MRNLAWGFCNRNLWTRAAVRSHLPQAVKLAVQVRNLRHLERRSSPLDYVADYRIYKAFMK